MNVIGMSQGGWSWDCKLGGNSAIIFQAFCRLLLHHAKYVRTSLPIFCWTRIPMLGAIADTAKKMQEPKTPKQHL